MMNFAEAVKPVRTVNQRPEASTWDKEALPKVCATPCDLHRPREPEITLREKADENKEDDIEEKVSLAHQVYTKPKDVEEHGVTRGFPRCDHQVEYRTGRAGKPNSQVCRARMMTKLESFLLGASAYPPLPRGWTEP